MQAWLRYIISAKHHKEFWIKSLKLKLYVKAQHYNYNAATLLLRVSACHGVVFATLHFLHNFGMGLIARVFGPWLAFPA
jgi:hypothetical protein